MPGKAKNNKELEERLKALKKEQRRLAREINALSRGDSLSGKAASKTSQKRAPSRKKARASKSRSKSSQSASNSGVEMKSYLSTGSFRGKRQLRHERAVQRNKAIFMIILAGAALYIFFMWVY